MSLCALGSAGTTPPWLLAVSRTLIYYSRGCPANPNRDDGDEDGQDVDIASTPDPVITTGGHVRELAKIISDPEAVKRLHETRSLQEATLSSDLLVRSDIDDAVQVVR